MSSRVDLYDSAYGNYELELYRQIRIETYGDDLGQTSWVTTEESDEIPILLNTSAANTLLEIGFGSGWYALRVAERFRCRVLGIDINPHAVHSANELARRSNVGAIVHFEQCDASNGLPAGDKSLDGVFANDVLCHLPDRLHVLREAYRVLKPGGRLLFSDALVVGGLISHEEIATRSSIGHYVFSPLGENERLIHVAGFQLLEVRDTSETAAAIARRWCDARSSRANDLIAMEGESNYTGLQRFLSGVYTLTSQRRLLRFLYLARK